MKFKVQNRNRILLLESDLAMAHLLRDYMSNLGCTIDCVENSNQAIEQLKSYKYDMLFITNKFEGMAPREFFKEVSSLFPSIQLVLVLPQLGKMPAEYLKLFKRVHCLATPIGLSDLSVIISQSA